MKYLIILLLAPLSAFSELKGVSCGDGYTEEERGFFWQCTEKSKQLTKENKSKPIEEPLKVKLEEEVVQPCTSSQTWSSSCGFVDPRNNYGFLQVQLEQLARSMVMNATDTNKTLEYQKLTRWMVNQVADIVSNWKWNVQNNLPYDQKQMGVTSFGLRLYKSSRDNTRKTIINTLKEEGGMLIFFSREDCSYCHDMLPIYKKVVNLSQLPMSNFSILGDCLIKNKNLCAKGNSAIRIATKAAVDVTPALYVYLPRKDKEGFYIRLSAGVESADRIYHRLGSYLQKAKKLGDDTLRTALSNKNQ